MPHGLFLARAFFNKAASKARQFGERNVGVFATLVSKIWKGGDICAFRPVDPPLVFPIGFGRTGKTRLDRLYDSGANMYPGAADPFAAAILATIQSSKIGPSTSMIPAVMRRRVVR